MNMTSNGVISEIVAMILTLMQKPAILFNIPPYTFTKFQLPRHLPSYRLQLHAALQNLSMRNGKYRFTFV